MADRRGYTSLYQNIPVQPLSGYSDPSAFIRVREAVRGLEDQVTQIRGLVGNSVPGYVSSVGLTAPTIFSVTGSPVTDTGTIALSLVSQTARSVFAAPTALAGTPSFRALEAADIQSGVFGITRGGTGLSSTPTNGQLLIGNGSGYTLAMLTAGTGISITNGVGSIQIDNSLPGFLNPMTTLGDIIYGGTAGAATRLGGETTTTRKFLRSVGVAGAATAPAWDTVTKTDVGLSNVENTALSTWAGSTNLTTLGTVTTGTWSATSIAPAKGGTGLTTAPAQDVIVYGGGSLSFSTLAPPSSGTNVLTWTSGIGITWTTKQVGTVTSVGLAAPTQFTVTNSPVTSSGTLTLAWVSQTANTVFAGPDTGAAAVPTFRALVAADIPNISAAKITSGTLALARGGTGADLSATGGTGQYVKQATMGGAFSVGTIPASDIASGQALTASNDTNVTLTLGGTPSTALLKAASITAGWSGQLSVARGGTALSSLGTANQVLGVNSGVTALEYKTVTAGTGISISHAAGSITITNTSPSSGGTVTSVTASSPLASSGGTTPNISLTGTVAIANGGTGQTTATAAFDALSPLTTLGDLIYHNGTDNVRLAGNTTTTKQFLRQTGNGTISAAPAWDTVTKTDVGLGNVENTALSTWAGSTNLITLGTVTTGTWSATTIAVNRGGTGLTSFTAGQILYASATTTIAGLSVTAGGLLYGGATAPAYTAIADLNWDNTNKRLGISQASPSYKLTVLDNNAALSTSNRVLSISSTISNTVSNGNTQYGIYNFLSVGNNIAGTPHGIYSIVDKSGGANLADINAISSQATMNSMGITVTNAAGFRAVSPTVTMGTFTNAYGLYIESQDVTNVGTGYGIYQAGTADVNYYGGRVFLNTTDGTTDPNARLLVREDVGGSTGMVVRNNDTGTTSLAFFALNTSTTGLVAYSFGSGYTTSGLFEGNGTALVSTKTNGLNIGATNAAGLLKFYTGGSASGNERMRIASNGNVTVDTNVLFVDAVNNRVGVNMTPTVALDVTGSAAVSGALTLTTVNLGYTTSGLQLRSSVAGASASTDYFFHRGADTTVMDRIVVHTPNASGAAFAHMTSGGVTRYLSDGSTGHFGVGTGSPGVRLDVSETQAIATTATFSAAAMRLNPAYTATGTITVKHRYIHFTQPTISGGTPTFTDAHTMYFDAAAGTHRAVDAGTTKTTPGTVNAWVKIDINGTTYYIPAYTSKTA